MLLQRLKTTCKVKRQQGLCCPLRRYGFVGKVHEAFFLTGVFHIVPPLQVPGEGHFHAERSKAESMEVSGAECVKLATALFSLSLE